MEELKYVVEDSTIVVAYLQRTYHLLGCNAHCSKTRQPST